LGLADASLDGPARGRGRRCTDHGGIHSPPRRGSGVHQDRARVRKVKVPGGCEGTIPGGIEVLPRVLVRITRSNNLNRGREVCKAEARHYPFTRRASVGPDREDPNPSTEVLFSDIAVFPTLGRQY
jgi:hypothetical protein